MATKRIGRTLKPYVQKARDAALLAVEVYNKPAVAFKTSAYVSLMVMAWTSLLHAIFLRNGVKPYYKDGDGKFETVDGDFKHWELAKCLKEHWGANTGDPVRLNLELFIPLRNRIEHRYLPELDAPLFGESQALLLNFDELMGKHFGAANQLRESLSFSLQLFSNAAGFGEAVKKNKSLAEVKKFIDDYRSMISPEAAGSGQFAFKAFLVQVANHESKDALSIQFIQQGKMTPEQEQQFKNFVVMTKWKDAGGGNVGLCKPGAIIAQVRAALGGPMVAKPAGTPLFNNWAHVNCWRRYKVRPEKTAANPDDTDKKYCVYDHAHKDYLYTKAWVDFLIEKMKDDAEFAAVTALKPKTAEPV